MGTRPHKSGTAPNMPFLRFWCETELSLQYSLVHIFADLIFQKRPAHLFFKKKIDNFQVQIKLPAQCCALLSITFADRAPNPRKQRPFGDHGSNFTRYPKKHRVSRRRVLSPTNSCATELLLHFPTSLCDGWLTWRCGWHDDGKADNDNRL